MARTEWFYVDRHGQRHGPVAAGALAEANRSGELLAEGLVWRDGLGQWQALSQVAVELGLGPPPMPPAAGANPPGPTADPPAGETPWVAGEAVPAGFLRRWAALIIDGLLLSAAFYAVLLVLMFGVGVATGLQQFEGDEPPDWMIGAVLVTALVYYVGAGFYYASLESGPHQATLGKRALGIKVTDAYGRRLGFGQALARWFAASLSYLTCYLGFLLAALPPHKRALHDYLAGTRVVDRWAWTAHPERQQTELPGCLTALLLALAGIVVLAVVGVLAAIALPAYSDYSERDGLADVLASAAPAKVAVAEFRAQADRCPRDAAELGLTTPAVAGLAGLEIGVDSEGRCVVDLRLGGGADLPEWGGDRLWLVLDEQGRWTCKAEGLADAHVPSNCR